MLILASTSDRLQVILSAAGSIDAHADWMDNVSGAVGPGRTNTTLAAAGTFDIVAPPAASTQRNVKTVHVRNRGAAVNDITVLHNDGTLAVALYKVSMPPGSTLEYIDEVGFLPLLTGI